MCSEQQARSRTATRHPATTPSKGAMSVQRAGGRGVKSMSLEKKALLLRRGGLFPDPIWDFPVIPFKRTPLFQLVSQDPPHAAPTILCGFSTHHHIRGCLPCAEVRGHRIAGWGAQSQPDTTSTPCGTHMASCQRGRERHSENSGSTIHTGPAGAATSVPITLGGEYQVPQAREAGCSRGLAQGTRAPVPTNSGCPTPEVPRGCSGHCTGPLEEDFRALTPPQALTGQSTQEDQEGRSPPPSDSHQAQASHPPLTLVTSQWCLLY